MLLMAVVGGRKKIDHQNNNKDVTNVADELFCPFCCVHSSAVVVEGFILTSNINTSIMLLMVICSFLQTPTTHTAHTDVLF